MAVLAAMGMLSEASRLFHSREHHRSPDSVVAWWTTTVSTANLQLPTANEIEAIIRRSRARPTSPVESTFLIDDRDPLKHGFRL